MAELHSLYKCEVCGNIVDVLHAGEGELVCCGKPMVMLKENTVDAALEKHVPVIEKIEGGYRVQVGSVLHPSEPKHYIEWIELHLGNKISRVFLKPGDKPVAEFYFCKECMEKETPIAKEYCNIHGYWKSK